MVEGVDMGRMTIAFVDLCGAEGMSDSVRC